MEEIFIFDQRNASFAYGHTKRPPGTPLWILFLLLGIPFLLSTTTILAALMAAESWLQWYDLRTHGVTAPGTIVSAGIVHATTTTTEQQRYYEYKFTVDGKDYRGRHVTKRGAVLSVGDGYTDEGDAVDIVYLRSDPTKSKIAGTATWPALMTSFMFILFVVTAVFLFVLLKFLGGLSGIRKMLPRSAECLPGELVLIEPNSTDASSSVQTDVVYRFTSPQSGECIEREQTCFLAPPKPLPECGQSVAVAYIDDQQHWLL